VSDEEMFRVFNMGIGFCVILPNDGAVLARAAEVCRTHGVKTLVIGEVTADPARRVHIEPKKIIGKGTTSTPRSEAGSAADQLDHRAPVHHHFQPRGARLLRRRLVITPSCIHTTRAPISMA